MYSGIRWSYEFTDCSMPVALDTYSLCSYNCLYCFSYYKPNKWNVKLEAIESARIMEYFTGDKIDTIYSDFIKDKKFIQWGGVTDPFDNYEKKFGKTLEILEFLKVIDYPLCFSTKGTWWTYDDRYRKLFRNQKNWITKFSIINLDEKLSKEIEIGTSSPEERLKAMGEISKINPGTTVLRLRPFIIGMSDKNDEYLDLIKMAKKFGVSAVSTEFLCIEQRTTPYLQERYKRMSDALGFDIVDFYRRNSVGSGYLVLSREIKMPYWRKMDELCRKLNMRLYVSDRHGKDFCANGSCCGLSKSQNYFRFQFTELLAGKKKGDKIYFWGKNEFPEFYHTILWQNCGVNTQNSRTVAKRYNQTLYDYLRNLWNSPNGFYNMFGQIVKPIGKDKSGNVVFEYKGKV